MEERRRSNAGARTCRTGHGSRYTGHESGFSEERAPRNCQGTITRRSGVSGWLIVGSLRNYFGGNRFAETLAFCIDRHFYRFLGSTFLVKSCRLPSIQLQKLRFSAQFFIRLRSCCACLRRSLCRASCAALRSAALSRRYLLTARRCVNRVAILQER